MRTNQDVIAVVTGANRGIGLEIVHQLADRGVTAVLTARQPDAGATAAATLAGEAGRVDFHPLSVTDEASIRALRDHVASQFGRLDVLVNNAGIITDTEAGGLDVSLATVRETLETNTLAPLRMAQMLLPLLKQSRAGRIVNMKIAVLGTGMVGNAIATKLVKIGHQIMMGSRIANSDAGQEWLRSVGGKAQCGTFADAAAFGDIVFDCTNGAHSLTALRQAGAANLRGKILIEVANPLDMSTAIPAHSLATSSFDVNGTV
jgi:nucleoside-diphosphate-sugar epimerase